MAKVKLFSTEHKVISLAHLEDRETNEFHEASGPMQITFEDGVAEVDESVAKGVLSQYGRSVAVLGESRSDSRERAYVHDGSSAHRREDRLEKQREKAEPMPASTRGEREEAQRADRADEGRGEQSDSGKRSQRKGKSS